MRHILSCAGVVALLGVGAPAAEPAPYPHEPIAKPVRYTARVTSDEGKIASITLHGAGLPAAGLEFKSDLGAFGKKLKELAAKHADDAKPPALVVEIDLKLLQGDVVKLLDASVRAGFTDISPVPLDTSKR